MDRDAEAPNTASIRDEVIAGLRRSPKEIHCKFFYDRQGSRLFDRICELEEYYPTRTELAIMRRDAAEMAALIGPRAMVIEYGSGSSLKTPLLLDALEDPVAYVPIDISRGHLEASAARLAERYREIEVLPVCGDYTGAIEIPPTRRSARRRVVYFPGSTIGNFASPETVAFLRRIAGVCGGGGGALIGADLKKDKGVLERAYDDREGVTAAFNLNLLQRFNRELGADFDLDGFRHLAFYDQELGRIEMHLVSRRRQTVKIGGERIDFAAGERIHTENSYKYSLEDFRDLAAAAGLEVERVWTDDDLLFSVQYLTVAG